MKLIKFLLSSLGIFIFSVSGAFAAHAFGTVTYNLPSSYAFYVSPPIYTSEGCKVIVNPSTKLFTYNLYVHSISDNKLCTVNINATIIKTSGQPLQGSFHQSFTLLLNKANHLTVTPGASSPITYDGQTLGTAISTVLGATKDNLHLIITTNLTQ